VLLVLVATVAAALVGWELAGRRVDVPKVVGASPGAAQAAISKAHLTARISATPTYSETVPKGAVAALQPGPGHSVSRGTTVTITLSLGPERYTVPTVTKLALADAVSALRVAHLRPGPQSPAYSDTVPAGVVVSSDPTPGVLVKPDTSVALVVSRGPAPVNPPNVAGLPPVAAQTALQKVGLRVTTSNDFNNTVPVGQVIAITPSTGLHRTQIVTLHVSKGPQMVRIPADIENYSPGYAKQVLQSLGLSVSIRSFPGLDSSLLTVRPSGGSLVRVGSQVTLFLY
jgi:serine/threonine-protein kinase